MFKKIRMSMIFPHWLRIIEQTERRNGSSDSHPEFQSMDLVLRSSGSPGVSNIQRTVFVRGIHSDLNYANAVRNNEYGGYYNKLPFNIATHIIEAMNAFNKEQVLRYLGGESFA